MAFLKSVCSRSRTLTLIGVNSMFALTVVNHLMVTIVKTAITLKYFIDMAILVIVQFEGKTKEYAFLTALDIIKEGTRVKDKRYDKPFIVKRTDFHFSTTYAGYPLKWITSSTIEWIKTPSTRFNNNQTSNNMEKRNITVSLEEARNWYNAKDQTLRKLALQAYTEKELREPHNFKEVLDSLEIHSIELSMRLDHKDDSSTLKLIKEINSELILNMKLMLIAKYFNGSWEPDIDKTKYFLAKTYSFNSPYSIKPDNGYCIGTHEGVMYPGIVYFQNQEDARKAYEMLKDELR